MSTEKAGCFDSYYIGVISQAHNGPTPSLKIVGHEL